ncbi:MAG: hypothetical protein KF767_13785 [Bdellovibrionaceae bacterium]|nr:hypothetical protein [Pseudobdellovibrionaceae bacterium]
MLKKSIHFGIMLTVGLSVSMALAKPAPKKSGRVPASATKACPETGCACDDLKSFAAKCEVKTHSEYIALAHHLKLDQDERRRAELKACPHSAAAETCRAKAKRQLTQKKMRGTPFKPSLMTELGNFGIELVEQSSKNPRSPASR